MYIEGKWYEEPEIQAYIMQLKKDHNDRFVTVCNVAGKLKNQNDAATDLLREAHFLLSRAFYAHFSDKNAADELYNKIQQFLAETE